MRTITFLLAAIAAGALGSGCGDGATDGTGGTSSPTAPGTPAATATATTPPSSPTPTPTDDAVRIAVSDGQVAGGPARVEVAMGEQVTIVVSSDVGDTVHLHGYDIEVPVAPGEPAKLTVTADIPGVFEIELEDAGLKVAELVVGG